MRDGVIQLRGCGNLSEEDAVANAYKRNKNEKDSDDVEIYLTILKINKILYGGEDKCFALNVEQN